MAPTVRVHFNREPLSRSVRLWQYWGTVFDWIKRLGMGATALPLVAQGGAVQGATRIVEAGDFHIHLDLSGQVLRLSLPDGITLRPEFRPEPALAAIKAAGPGFVSAAVLAAKGKQFDDGLYAAVELALEKGAGTFRGKQWLLDAVSRELAGLPADPRSNVPGILFGARLLGSPGAAPPRNLAPAVAAAVAQFQADQTRSKPISFYTWSEDLRRIFQQDRMLQSELTGAGGIGALVQALQRSGAGPVYETWLQFTSRLTNPSPADMPDLRRLLHDAGAPSPARGLYFLPPSRAHETELVKKLFGARPIPEGFNLGEKFISELRAGSLDTSPREDSGWYDLQTWAHAALVLIEKLPEGKKLQIDSSYRLQLEELFKGLLALTRETHIKQLEFPPAGAAAERQPVLILSPELSVEPAYSYYLRRAAGYGFLRDILEAHFGAGALSNLHRLTATGPVAADLRSELQEVSGLFYGASVVAARELGLSDGERAKLEAPSAPVRRLPGSGRGPAGDAALFESWAARCEKDIDLGRDARMMAPLFYDVGRRKTKVWAFLGWARTTLEVEFAGRPPIQVVDRQGRPTPKSTLVQLRPRWYSLPFPVTAEVYVTRLLDRTEFQALCEKHRTVEAILRHLSQL